VAIGDGSEQAIDRLSHHASRMSAAGSGLGCKDRKLGTRWRSADFQSFGPYTGFCYELSYATRAS